MSGLREVLESAPTGLDPDSRLPLDGVSRVGDRRPQRNRVLVGGLLVAALAWALVAASWPRSTPRVAAPHPPVARSGAVRHADGPLVVGRDGTLVAFDAMSGRLLDSSAVPLPPGPVPVGWAWSPDGRVLAYTDGAGLRTFDPAVGTSRMIATCSGCGPAWSPDGARIAYADGPYLRIVDLATSVTTTVHQAGVGTVQHPTWSPDGTQIAFSVASASAWWLEAVRTDGSSHRVLVGPWTTWITSPSWSPDGSSIAFVTASVRSVSTGQRTLQVMTVPADSSQALGPVSPSSLLSAGSCTCVGFAPGLGWSPDGSQLAVVVPLGGFSLQVMDADGTGLRQVTTGVSGDPAWRPAR